ncbi:MAG TPA: CPBP family intramembrane glutamic endopeptidase [Candidatus Aquilonibacter sp.]|nr:CPBP family intramembrane glutamic endopeptidase [Candidatus Aquilonibacter sp.]
MRWPADSFRPLPTALLIVGVVVAGALALFAASAVVLVRYSGHPPIVPLLVANVIGEGLPVLIVLLALPAVSKRSYAELGFAFPNLRQIGISILGMIAMTIVVSGGASLAESLSHQKHEQLVVELGRQALHDPHTAWFFILFAVVIAPFMEETIFRLFVFNLGRRYGGFWPGAILSGVLFGLAHWDPFASPALVLGGIILCAIYARTRNAFASMITHGLFNGLTILALIFAPNLAK